MKYQRIRILPRDYIPKKWHGREVWVEDGPPLLMQVSDPNGVVDIGKYYRASGINPKSNSPWVVPYEDVEIVPGFAEIEEPILCFKFESCIIDD